jgi:hypothetical protein
MRSEPYLRLFGIRNLIRFAAWFSRLHAWFCRLLHQQGDLKPAPAQAREQPRITMVFRLRRSARLGPRTTVGLPGTGLSWSVEHATDRPVAIPA